MKYNHMTAYFRIFAKKGTSVTFPKIDIKGKYVPKGYISHNSPIDDEEYYSVKLKEYPKEEGKYKIFFEQGNAWVDERDEYADKRIIRVKGTVKFERISGLNTNAKKESLKEEADTEAVGD